MRSGPGKSKLLLFALAPLSMGVDPKIARAQSVPPVRQSLPPRPASLAPRRKDEGEQPGGPAEEEAEASALSGDWGGGRSWLEEHGVVPELTLTLEGFTRTSGGTGSRQPRAALGAFDATLDLDTQALGAWPGGALDLHFEAIEGKGVSDDHIGALQAVSNREGEPHASLVEYWYRQDFWGGKLALKVGRMDGNVDFAASDYAGGLLNSSFGVFPTLSLPDMALGAAVFVHPFEWLAVRAAVSDGDPEVEKPFGGTHVFEGVGGRLSVGELELRTLTRMPSVVRLGGWYHTADVAELPTSAGQTELTSFGANYGVYAMADQALTPVRGEETQAGFFGQVGYSPEDRNEAKLYLGGGLVYRGLIPTRDADAFTLGVAHVELGQSPRALEGRTRETVLEASYEFRATKFLAVQPDFQWVHRPGGGATPGNATLAGVRITTTL